MWSKSAYEPCTTLTEGSSITEEAGISATQQNKTSLRQLSQAQSGTRPQLATADSADTCMKQVRVTVTR